MHTAAATRANSTVPFITNRGISRLLLFLFNLLLCYWMAERGGKSTGLRATVFTDGAFFCFFLYYFLFLTGIGTGKHDHLGH